MHAPISISAERIGTAVMMPVPMVGRLVAASALALCLSFAAVAPSIANPLFPAPPSVMATVSLQDQRMEVTINLGDGQQEKYSWKVSTGRNGFNTPPGKFRPDYLDPMHFSSKYENAPMPFAVFFNDGIAVHGTTELRNLGRPASHGCVRLDPANAEIFFKAVSSVGMMRTAIVVQ
jgi:lipoprotein-anchoring transpeptidase ErfK/SrfK